MGKYWTVLALCLISSFSISAQNWEGGFFGGASNYRGDLSPYITPSETHSAQGFYLKRNLSQFFSFNFGLTQGTISADDQNYKHLQKRNLSFKSQITELSATVEFNFFPFLKGLKPNQFTPFVFTGLGFFRFNPKTEYNGRTYELAKYNTEGQGITKDAPSEYSLYQPSIPMGGGLKLRLAKRLNLGFRVGYRATFFDFLDDVSTNYPSKEALDQKGKDLSIKLSDRSKKSETYYTGPKKQRGDPQNNDWYVFAGITLSYHIKNSICYDFN